MLIKSESSILHNHKGMRMNTIHDVLIIGAGPAGIASALLCKRHGLAYQVLESGKAVFQGIANTYPPGKLVYPSKPKDAPEPFLVGELQPPDEPVTVESYLRLIQQFVKDEGLSIRTEVSFQDISEERGILTVNTDRGSYKARRVILAFGCNIPRELTVYGDAKMVAKGLDDVEKYIGLKTLVIGGGNTAADVIISILKAKREAGDDNPVFWAHRRETFGVNKETAQRLGEEILLGGNIRLLPGAIPRIGEVDREGIERLVIRINEFHQADGIDLYHALSFPMQNVIACIGSQGPGPIFEKIGIQLITCTGGVCKIGKEGERLALLTSEFESTRRGIHIIGGAISPSFMRISEGSIVEEKHPNLIYTALNDAFHVIEAIRKKLA